ncbi:membrane protein [Citricoccus sp. SGAir0253]|uniref:YczE/YyaS/YitT family protein n=1 Tax=Citricoccus sp. SGAir0253 TaxID=2567881 RepID=UPI0010CD4798|nr:DUF6198 family protein [Citricoccus sp. SGAir0253]QCU79181.1 membrane protein [Citricoccus sp. SGAir0253]
MEERTDAGTPPRSTAGRWLRFFLGIFILAFGIALSIRAGLGATPISTIPNVLAAATPFTVGAYIAALNMVFVLLQLALLRRRFPPLQLLQVPLTLVFGLMCDVALWATEWIEPVHYAAQAGWTVLSVVVAAVGVYIEVNARIAYLPGDGIVVVLHRLLGARFGTVKQVFDWTLVVLAVALSLALLGQLYGVREGTLLSALGVGALIKAIESLHSRWQLRRRAAPDAPGTTGEDVPGSAQCT